MSPRGKLARALGYLGALPVSAAAATVVPLVAA